MLGVSFFLKPCTAGFSFDALSGFSFAPQNSRVGLAPPIQNCLARRSIRRVFGGSFSRRRNGGAVILNSDYIGVKNLKILSPAIYCRVSFLSRDSSRLFSSLKSQILNTYPERSIVESKDTND